MPRKIDDTTSRNNDGDYNADTLYITPVIILTVYGITLYIYPSSIILDNISWYVNIIIVLQFFGDERMPIADAR